MSSDVKSAPTSGNDCTMLVKPVSVAIWTSKPSGAVKGYSQLSVRLVLVILVAVRFSGAAAWVRLMLAWFE